MMFLLPCTAYQPYPAQFPNLNAVALKCSCWGEKMGREEAEGVGAGLGGEEGAGDVVVEVAWGWGGCGVGCSV